MNELPIETGEAQAFMEELYAYLLDKVPTVILAIIVLFVGLRVVALITKLFRKSLERNNVEVTVRRFVGNLINWLLKVALILSVASMLGIETTSFIAILGAAGLAVGLALQGTLQNFAGGVVILVLKPFKVGDFIDAVGYMGTVDEIQIFVTKLRTPQNRVVIIPNSKLSNDSLVNFSAQETVRIDFTIGVGYESDLQKTKEVLEHIVSSDTRILKDPEPQVVVGELADSSVNFYVRPWVKSEDYWDVYFDVTERMKLELDAAGINIPFPQMDVHVQQNGNA